MAESAITLEPLKTLHECRSDEQFVRAFVIEIPSKLTGKALSIVKPIIPSGGKHPSFAHLRRLVTLTHLPIDLAWRREYDARGLSTVFLLVPNTVVSWEDIKKTLDPHIDIPGLPRCFDAIVPRFAPLNAEQAVLWTERYWPSIYNPASQVLQDAPPLHQLRKMRTSLEAPSTDRFMQLAFMAAAEAEKVGQGRSIGAVVVDPETGTVVAVAGDARWHSSDPSVDSTSTLKQDEGRPEFHALMRVIAMVANKELRRRIKAGTHNKFLATCSESPAGQAFTSIEAQYEDDGRVLQDLTHGLNSVILSHNKELELPEKQSAVRSDGYLCSGLDIYLTHEPCVCCAMAMIHSRFRACVFARRMPGSGGLTAEANDKRMGYGLFWRRELNWRVMTFQHIAAVTVDSMGRTGLGIFHA